MTISKIQLSVYGMAKSDVEVHRQASTRNDEHVHLGDNRLKVEHLSPVTKSYTHGASDQLTTVRVAE